VFVCCSWVIEARLTFLCQIRLWDAHSCLRSARPTPKAILRGHSQGVLCVDFSAREDLLVSASADNTVRVWSTAQERSRHTLTGHINKVTSAHFASTDNHRVISGSHDRSLKVWDLTKGYCIKTIFCFSACNSVGISADGRTAVSGHFDNSVRFWDTKTGESSAELTDVHSGQVTSVAFFPLDDRYVLTNSRDHRLALIDTRMSRKLRTFSHEAYRNGVNWNHAAFSSDGEFVVAGGADGGLFVWGTHTGDVVTPDEAPLYLGATKAVKSAALTCVAWSPDGLPVAACDKSGNLKMFE
jgi:autophagy-related protein 16-1